MREALEGLIRRYGYTLHELHGQGRLRGLTVALPSFKRVYIRTNMSETETLATLAHELAHVVFEDGSATLAEEREFRLILQELRANEFARLLLEPHLPEMVKMWHRDLNFLLAECSIEESEELLQALGEHLPMIQEQVAKVEMELFACSL